MCNLPPAPLAEWPESFTCHCGNTGWNGHQTKKKILPSLLPGFKLTTFWSRIWHSTSKLSHFPVEYIILHRTVPHSWVYLSILYCIVLYYIVQYFLLQGKKHPQFHTHIQPYQGKQFPIPLYSHTSGKQFLTSTHSLPTGQIIRHSNCLTLGYTTCHIHKQPHLRVNNFPHPPSPQGKYPPPTASSQGTPPLPASPQGQ